VWVANRRAKRAYRLQPYPGKITYFRSREGKYGARPNSRDGWEQLALGGFEVHEIPGDHHTMLEEPHVRVLAAKLASCLCAPQAPQCEEAGPQHEPDSIGDAASGHAVSSAAVATGLSL
jgi:thioesterase domain-containing protein